MLFALFTQTGHSLTVNLDDYFIMIIVGSGTCREMKQHKNIASIRLSVHTSLQDSDHRAYVSISNIYTAH